MRLDGAHVEPGGDVFSRLVYACTSRDVVDVLVDGEPVVRNREHERLDAEQVKARARVQARKLSARAGL